MRRFHRTGLSALFIAAGRGRKATYISQERQQVLECLRSTPDRQEDQSATWSLRLLQRTLRRGVRKAGVVTVHDPQAQEKQRLIELAYRIAEAAGVELWCQDEAGVYAMNDPTLTTQKC